MSLGGLSEAWKRGRSLQKPSGLFPCLIINRIRPMLDHDDIDTLIALSARYTRPSQHPLTPAPKVSDKGNDPKLHHTKAGSYSPPDGRKAGLPASGSWVFQFLSPQKPEELSARHSICHSSRPGGRPFFVLSLYSTYVDHDR